MSATIKRYDINQNGLDCHYQPCAVMEPASTGDYVLHADHLASHQYDEENERALFEAQRQPNHCIKFADGSYQYVDVDLKWQGWQLCAKSRAKAAGGE